MLNGVSLVSDVVAEAGSYTNNHFWDVSGLSLWEVGCYLHEILDLLFDLNQDILEIFLDSFLPFEGPFLKRKIENYAFPEPNQEFWDTGHLHIGCRHKLI